MGLDHKESTQTTGHRRSKQDLYNLHQVRLETMAQKQIIQLKENKQKAEIKTGSTNSELSLKAFTKELRYCLS